MANRAYSRAGIISRLFNQPLAVLPETAAIVLGAVGERLDVAQLLMPTERMNYHRSDLECLAASERQAIAARGGLDRQAKMLPADALMFVHNGVAHVGVRGETVAENGTIGPSSGFTGYDGIVAAVQSADADPAVRGILLDIDSPGGEVAGLFEAASILSARRGGKPMRAMIRGTGCSAAYALAACADDITLHDLGRAGSIGVITMHADYSAALEAEGVKVTLFTSGAHKADGNPFGPLPADVAASIQSLIDIAASRFHAHVAASRGLSVEAVKDQQARVYQGEDAVAAGLVDKIMSWQDSMDEFEAAVNAPASRRGASAPSGARSAKGPSMSNPNPAPAAEQQPEFTQAQMDAAMATARAEGHADGLTAAATAERERFTALAELDSGSKVSAELATAMAEGTSVADFALAQSRAAKAKVGAALNAAEAEAVPAAAMPAGGNPAASGAKPEANRGKALLAKRQAAAAR
jgi:signal peptide peptidase SppA